MIELPSTGERENMTTDFDQLSWKAHVHIDLFLARDERDAMHTLHPARAKIVDLAHRKGYRLPKIVVPHISGCDMERLGMSPIGVRDEAGNLLANAGINRLEDLLIGAGGQAYDNTHCALLVGDTNTAATAADTDLNATVNASNRYAQVMDSTFPSRSSQTLSFKATYTTGNANFAWAEWGIAGNTSSGASAATAPLLNHKVTSLLTKTSAVSAAFTVTVVIS